MKPVDLLDDDMPECVGEFLLQEKRSVKQNMSQLSSSLPTEEEVLGGRLPRGSRISGNAMNLESSFDVLLQRETEHDKIVGPRGTYALSIRVSRHAGPKCQYSNYHATYAGIKNEWLDSSPYKESASLSVTGLAGLIQVQSEAI
jgi:hypothetical protein